MTPVDAGERIAHLGRRDGDDAVGGRGPEEATVLEAADVEVGRLSIVPDDLPKVASAPAGAEDVAAQRITLRDLLRQQGERGVSTGLEPWFFRTSCDAAGSGRGEDALTQKREAGAAEHRALEHLEPPDLTLHRARRPGQLDRVAQRLKVAPQTGGELPQRRPSCSCEPPLQALARASSHEVSEPRPEGGARRQTRRLRAQPVEEAAVVLAQRARVRL